MTSDLFQIDEWPVVDSDYRVKLKVRVSVACFLFGQPASQFKVINVLVEIFQN